MAHSVVLQTAWAVKQGELEEPLLKREGRSSRSLSQAESPIVELLNLPETTSSPSTGMMPEETQESQAVKGVVSQESNIIDKSEEIKTLDAFLSLTSHSSSLIGSSHPSALKALLQVEKDHPRLRWAYFNHLLESLGAWAFIGEKDIDVTSTTNSRVFIQGHGLWMNNQSVLRKIYATNGFRQGFEFILHRGVHLGLLGLTAAQFATATSFVDFFDKFWNGDEYAITALAYATSRTQDLNALYSLLAIPFIWGGR